MKSSVLLTIDAGINLVLGILLIFFPKPLVEFLGVPVAENAFYPSLLGAVLFGIGVALLIERFHGPGGLGLPGAISINLSGGVILAIWLISGQLTLPIGGLMFLIALVILLVGISLFELISYLSHKSR